MSRYKERQKKTTLAEIGPEAQRQGLEGRISGGVDIAHGLDVEAERKATSRGACLGTRARDGVYGGMETAYDRFADGGGQKPATKCH